jgi:methionyl-tRNA formyltransferase
LKVLVAAVESWTSSRPGTVLATDRTKGLLVATGRDALWLRRVRPAGRRTMSGDEFARGARLRPGTSVGGRPGQA